MKTYKLSSTHAILFEVFEKKCFSSREEETHSFKSPPVMHSGRMEIIGSSSSSSSFSVGSSSEKRIIPKGSLVKHLDRRLTDAETKQINLNIARFIYSSGIALHHVNNPFLKAVFTGLNTTFVNGATDWNIRHHLLDDVSGEVAEKVEAKEEINHNTECDCEIR